MDTVTLPDVFMSVVRVSEGNDEGRDPEGIRSTLEADKDSIDFLAIASDSDPLCFPGLYKLIRSVRPPGVKVMVITDGRDPSILDDLIGAGYANAVDLKVGRELTGTQMECIRITDENGCKLIATIELIGHNESTISCIVNSLGNCKTVVLKQVKNQPVTKSELSAILSAVRRRIWDVKLG